MQIAFSHAHFPVTSLGPGRRVGLWLQGCKRQCAGCIASHTWDVHPTQHFIYLDRLLTRLTPWLASCDGVTLSGGEPFEQPEALMELLRRLRQHLKSQADVLVYSGYPEKELRARHSNILAGIDVLIPEPYIEELPTMHPLLGSANQKVVFINEAVRARYAYLPPPEEPPDSSYTRTMGITQRGDKILMAGIPRRGDMRRLRELIRPRTQELGDTPTTPFTNHP